MLGWLGRRTVCPDDPPPPAPPPSDDEGVDEVTVSENEDCSSNPYTPMVIMQSTPDEGRRPLPPLLLPLLGPHALTRAASSCLL